MAANSDVVPLYPSDYSSKIQLTPLPVVHQPEPLPPAPLAQSLLGPENTVTVCQFCRASIRTAVTYTTTSRTHIAAALWCTFCCLCCVPYASDSAKNADHYCPNCQRYLGTYVR